MTNWKTKLFGDNRMNFFGWCLTGLFVIGASLWKLKEALDAGVDRKPEGSILVGIYFLLLGIFGLTLHNYIARVAAKLDKDDEGRDDSSRAA
jgi:hypothetical protein